MLIGLLFDLALVTIFPVMLLGALLGAQRLETFVSQGAQVDRRGAYGALEDDGQAGECSDVGSVRPEHPSNRSVGSSTGLRAKD